MTLSCGRFRVEHQVGDCSWCARDVVLGVDVTLVFRDGAMSTDRRSVRLDDRHTAPVVRWGRGEGRHYLSLERGWYALSDVKLGRAQVERALFHLIGVLDDYPLGFPLARSHLFVGPGLEVRALPADYRWGGEDAVVARGGFLESLRELIEALRPCDLELREVSAWRGRLHEADSLEALKAALSSSESVPDIDGGGRRGRSPRAFRLSSDGDVLERVRDIFEKYGRLGLLLDDVEATEFRVARELFGVERLPGWWLAGRSIRHAADLLGAALSVRAEMKYPGSLVVIIDRFMPLSCRGDGERVTWAWDEPGQRTPAEVRWEARGLAALIEQTRALARGGDVHLEFTTSFPYTRWGGEFAAPGRGRGEALPWNRRSIEVLYRFGQAYREADSDLGFFSQDADQDRLIELKDALRNEEEVSCILVLGDGATSRVSDYGYGTHGVDWMSTYAMLHHRSSPGSAGVPDPERLELPSLHRGCAGCHPPDTPKNGAALDYTALVEKIDASSGRSSVGGILTDGTWIASLQVLLSSIPLEEVEESRRFRVALMRALHAVDQGFPHHLWQLAQLPWEAVVSLSHDRQFERAAMAAAREPGDNSRALQLGCVHPEGVDFDPERGRLFRPFGALLSGVELDSGAVRERVEGVLKRLGERTKGEVWLVVVGDTQILSKSICECFWTRGNGRRFRLVSLPCGVDERRFSEGFRELAAMTGEERSASKLEEGVVGFASDLMRFWLGGETELDSAESSFEWRLDHGVLRMDGVEIASLWKHPTQLALLRTLMEHCGEDVEYAVIEGTDEFRDRARSLGEGRTGTGLSGIKNRLGKALFKGLEAADKVDQVREAVSQWSEEQMSAEQFSLNHLFKNRRMYSKEETKGAYALMLNPIHCPKE